MIKWCRSESADKGGALGKHRIPDYINSGSCHYEHVSACKHFLPYFTRCPHRLQVALEKLPSERSLGFDLYSRSASQHSCIHRWKCLIKCRSDSFSLLLFFFARKVEIALSFFSIRFVVLQILCTLVFKAPVHVFRSMTERLSVHLKRCFSTLHTVILKPSSK